MQPLRLELPTNMQVGSVNAYLFTEPEPVLVDAGIGSDACWAALKAALADHGLTPADIRRVVVTHPHVDHYGLAGRMADSAETEIWIADGGVAWLEPTRSLWQARYDYYENSLLPALGYSAEMVEVIMMTLVSLNGLVDPVPMAQVRTFPRDGVVQMGGLDWQVVDAPGHASLQSCFYQPETRQLISADHLMSIAPTPIIEAPPPGQTEHDPALPNFLASLEKVRALAVDQVWPGHGQPFRNHRRVIDRQVARIERRTQETQRWIGLGRETAITILDEMYGHLPELLRFAGMYMLIGYLDLLLAEGTILRHNRDKVWHFTLA